MLLKTKVDLYWNLGFLVLSIVIVGLVVDFRLVGSVDVQLHDTYFVITPLQAIIRLAGILILFRYFFILIDQVLLKNRIIALLTSIIFGIVLVILISITGMTLTNWPPPQAPAFLLTILAEFALIIYFGLLEFKSLRKTFWLLE